ncbi:hypothetical protein PRIPAC_77205 [Pristionchus pacificus]|uniref:Uncharacterized protein n=1 Tax=Pristionchus pacificus TaxID=54126 RepID=A0A2A6CP03_PRIPA|nr:hypothetical protein PRIPAC_77205 [Pristionchus pacificus]|eukprot:PDM79828.1 hypothetical protein PRIPAC_32407 [Pristionchus pacificus]
MEGSVVNVDAAIDPDDIVYDPHYDNLEDGDDNEDIYAVVELGADGKPRYLLSKIHNFFYTASNDVRRSNNGQYLSRKELVKIEQPIKAWGTTTTSALSSNSTSSGGLRKKIASAIQVCNRFACFYR